MDVWHLRTDTWDSCFWQVKAKKYRHHHALHLNRQLCLFSRIVFKKAAPKATPPFLLCCLTETEADSSGMADSGGISHQY